MPQTDSTNAESPRRWTSRMFYPFPFDPPSRVLNAFFFLSAPIFAVFFGSNAGASLTIVPLVMSALLSLSSPKESLARPVLTTITPAFYAFAGAVATGIAARTMTWSGITPDSELALYVLLVLASTPTAWSYLAAGWRIHLALIESVHRSIYAPLFVWLVFAASIVYMVDVKIDGSSFRFEPAKLESEIAPAMIGVISALLVTVVVQFQVAIRPKKKLRKQRNTAILLASLLVGAGGIACALAAIQSSGNPWFLDALYLASAPTVLSAMIGTQLATIKR